MNPTQILELLNSHRDKYTPEEFHTIEQSFRMAIDVDNTYKNKLGYYFTEEEKRITVYAWISTPNRTYISIELWPDGEHTYSNGEFTDYWNFPNPFPHEKCPLYLLKESNEQNS